MVFTSISFFGTKNQHQSKINNNTDKKYSDGDGNPSVINDSDVNIKKATNVFELLLLNCQGLTTEKTDYIFTEYITNNRNLKFLCLTEIWQSEESIGSKVFEDFNISASYIRKKFIHGGVGIWSHTDLKVKPLLLDQFCIEKDIEICGISYIDSTKTNHMILTCYRSPCGNLSTFCDHIEKILNQIWKPKTILTLTGDFNLDPIRDIKQYTLLNNILNTFDLKNIINKPTRGEYILDHIYIYQ